MDDPLGKILAVLVGAALVCVFGKLGVDAFRDYRSFDDAPTRSTLLAAVEGSTSARRWVSVEGAPWRCGEILTNVPGGAAFLPASTEDGSLVVARFDMPVRCGEVVRRPLVGVIEPMTPERAADLRTAGLAGGGRLRTLDVCASCGKGNARLGVLVCACLVILGLGLYPLRLAFQSWNARVGAWAHEAIHAAPDRMAEGDRRLRIWGGAVLAAGAVGFVVGEGWVAYGVVPVRWIGVLGVLLGGWMAAFPGSYRRVAARGRGASGSS